MGDMYLPEYAEKLVRDIRSWMTLFPTVLCTLIVEYWIESDKVRYETKPAEIWDLPKSASSSSAKPLGLVSDGEYLYVCQKEVFPYVLTYNLMGSQIEMNSFPLLKVPTGINRLGSLFYILEEDYILIYNMKRELKATWQLPERNASTYRSLAVDVNSTYLTIFGFRYVFILDTFKGTLERKIGSGKGNRKPGDFYTPCGLAIDRDYVYVCDYIYNLVQVLSKDRNFASHAEIDGSADGKLINPYALHISYGILYVGDMKSIQLFDCNKNYTFLQTIGESQGGNGLLQFKFIAGIWIVKDKLYVSDSDNFRIKVYRRSEI